MRPTTPSDEPLWFHIVSQGGMQIDKRIGGGTQYRVRRGDKIADDTLTDFGEAVDLIEDMQRSLNNLKGR